jgi:hypothetical protein
MKTWNIRVCVVVAVAVCIGTGATIISFHRPPAFVRDTIVFDSAGRRMRTLFDGLSYNPRYEPRLIALMQPPVAACRRTWLDKLIAWVQPVVQAQTSCNVNGCGQCNAGLWEPGEQTCPCSEARYPWAISQPTSPSAGVTNLCDQQCSSCSQVTCGTNVCSPTTAPGCVNDSNCPLSQRCSNGHCVDTNCDDLLTDGPCHGNGDCTKQ